MLSSQREQYTSLSLSFGALPARRGSFIIFPNFEFQITLSKAAGGEKRLKSQLEGWRLDLRKHLPQALRPVSPAGTRVIEERVHCYSKGRLELFIKDGRDGEMVLGDTSKV